MPIRRTKTIATLILVAALVLMIINTRFGVFIVFDVLADGTDNLELDSAKGPLVVNEELTQTDSIALPAHLEQASGIEVNGDRLLVSTDQAELFELDRQGNFLAMTRLLQGPVLLVQGQLESIVLVDDTLIAIGELGDPQRWHKTPAGWQQSESLDLSPQWEELEFTGVTNHQNELFAITDDGLDLYNLTTGKKIKPDYKTVTRTPSALNTVMVSGIASDAEYLYLITENFASVIRIDPADWRAVTAWDIDDVEASDLAIENGLIFVTVDHNYFDPRPPVLVYALPE